MFTDETRLVDWRTHDPDPYDGEPGWTPSYWGPWFTTNASAPGLGRAFALAPGMKQRAHGVPELGGRLGEQALRERLGALA